jgi:hypothetical protein
VHNQQGFSQAGVLGGRFQMIFRAGVGLSGYAKSKQGCFKIKQPNGQQGGGGEILGMACHQKNQ